MKSHGWTADVHLKAIDKSKDGINLTEDQELLRQNLFNRDERDARGSVKT